MLHSLRGNDAGDITPTFTGPADVDAHRETVNDQIQQLNLQIQPQSTVSPDFLQSWNGFVASWNKFYISNKAEGWISKSLSARSMYEQIDQYASQVPNWASQFQKLGGKLQGPLASLADKPDDTTLSGLLSGATGLVVAAGAVAAIVILGPKLVKGA